jgi:myosin heavy subunit
MDVMGIDKEQQSQVFRLVASILHLGNLTFKPLKEASEVADKSLLNLVASLMMVRPESLERYVI